MMAAIRVPVASLILIGAPSCPRADRMPPCTERIVPRSFVKCASSARGALVNVKAAARPKTRPEMTPVAAFAEMVSVKYFAHLISKRGCGDSTELGASDALNLVCPIELSMTSRTEADQLLVNQKILKHLPSGMGRPR